MQTLPAVKRENKAGTLVRCRKQAKRGQGEGSITQRKDGAWQAAVSVGEGKFCYGKTRREVGEKLKVGLREQQQGMLATGPSQTVEHFTRQWPEDVAKPTLRPNGYKRYEQDVRLHLVPTLGKLALGKLTAQHLTALYRELSKKLAAKPLGHVHRCLHVALEAAVRWDLIARNPCDLVSPPKVQRKEIQPLDVEQAKALLAAIKGEPLESLYVLALMTGARHGELLGLKWSDVDLAAGTLQIRRSLVRVTGQGFVEQEPKTQKGRRQVTLAPGAVEALKRQRATQLEARLRAASEWEDHELVFCNVFGRPLEPANIRARSFKPILHRAGLPDIRFHDLRHSAATLLLALGVHPRIVQEQLGHSTISITLDTYSHVLPTLQSEAMRRLDGLLTG